MKTIPAICLVIASLVLPACGPSVEVVIPETYVDQGEVYDAETSKCTSTDQTSFPGIPEDFCEVPVSAVICDTIIPNKATAMLILSMLKQPNHGAWCKQLPTPCEPWMCCATYQDSSP